MDVTEFDEFTELMMGARWVKIIYPDGSVLHFKGSVSMDNLVPGCIFSEDKNKHIKIPGNIQSMELSDEPFILEEVDEFANRFI